MNDSSSFSQDKDMQATERPVGVATPIQSIEVVNELVSVMFTYNRSVMYKDLGSLVKLHPANISQGLSATRDVGLTRLSGGKGRYILTQNGVEYGRLITAGKDAEARNCLRNIIEKNPAWTDILLFLKATRGQARDPLDLVLDIERKLGKKWSSGMRNRLRASYVSMLTYVGLVQKEGTKIVSLVESKVEKTPSMQLGADTLLVEPSIKEKAYSHSMSKDFARLQTEDFSFEVRKEAGVFDFAEAQFLVWIEYLRKKLAEDNSSVDR